MDIPRGLSPLHRCIPKVMEMRKVGEGEGLIRLFQSLSQRSIITLKEGGGVTPTSYLFVTTSWLVFHFLIFSFLITTFSCISLYSLKIYRVDDQIFMAMLIHHPPSQLQKIFNPDDNQISFFLVFL